MAESDTSPAFKINNSSDSFSAKSNDIFGCLSVIEKKHEAHQKDQSNSDEAENLVKPDPEEEESQFGPHRSRRGHCDRSELNQGRPQNFQSTNRSEFTRPYPPSRFRPYRGRGARRTPDFKTNPQRWTKYSLEDVEGKDMTESSNTKAAFEFLEDRRRQKEMDEDPDSFIAANVEETACSRGAVLFVRKKKGKSVTPDEKSQDVALPQDESLDSEEVETPHSGESLNVEDGQDLPKEEQKVTFKSKKGKQRNIRSRRDDDQDEEQNG